MHETINHIKISGDIVGLAEAETNVMVSSVVESNTGEQIFKNPSSVCVSYEQTESYEYPDDYIFTIITTVDVDDYFDLNYINYLKEILDLREVLISF